MKLLPIFAALLLALALSGCDSDIDTPTFNANATKEITVVTTLPDGRKVKMLSLRPYVDSTNVDRVYFVDSTGAAAPTVTVNAPEGKYRKTTVFVDGIEYTPVLEDKAKK